MAVWHDIAIVFDATSAGARRSLAWARMYERALRSLATYTMPREYVV